MEVQTEQLENIKHTLKQIEIKNLQLNDTLLRDIKSLIPSAVYQLFYNEVSSRWGKLHRLETTDFICEKIVSIARDSEKEKAEISERLETENKQLKQQVQSLRNIQAEINQNDLIVNLEDKLKVANKTVDNLTAQLTLQIDQSDLVNDLKNKLGIANQTVGNLKAQLALQTVPTPETRGKDPKNKMEAYERISKLVMRMVPVFSGHRDGFLASRVAEFLSGCDLVKKCIKPEEEAVFIAVLSTRLTGEAFQLYRNELNIKTLSDVEKLFKTTYLAVRTLDNVMFEIKQVKQSIGETIRSFHVRLCGLASIAREIIQAQYPLDQSTALLAETNRTVTMVFKVGLNNITLRQFILANPEIDLNKVVEEAVKLEQVLKQGAVCDGMLTPLGMAIQPSQAVQQYVPQFTQSQYSIEQPQQTQSYGTQNSNVGSFLTQPYGLQASNVGPVPLQSCGLQNTNLYPEYSHLNMSTTANSNWVGTQQQKPEFGCDFCGKPGHTYAACRVRKNTPYCESCSMYGHLKANCVSQKATVAQVISGAPEREEKKSKARCNWCGRFSHSEENCYFKKEYIKKSENMPGASQNN